MADRLCTQLVYLDGQSKTETITLCINSGGGDGTAFLAIRNMINSISAPVDTVNMGFAGSNAANLFLSATGKRYCVKDSAFFIMTQRNAEGTVKQYVTPSGNLLRTYCNCQLTGCR
jgi:ATP-dependent Clp protease protease subunit